MGQSLFSLIPPRTRVDQPDLMGLVDLQNSMMRNYFRLARLEEGLRRGRRTAPRVLAADALENERARLARELHAGAGQALAGIKIHLELIDSLLEDPPTPVRTSLDRIGLLAQEALEQVRSITRRTYPPAWERVRLAEAIRKLWSVTGIPQGFEAHLDIGAIAEEPPREIRTLLYRAAQEALVNVIRHAHATRVRLRLWQAGGRILLAVEDNGHGFDAARILSPRGAPPEGIGVRSISDQAAAVGGEFHLRSGAGGTTFSVAVPMPES